MAVSSYLFTRVLRWGLDSRFNRTRYIPHLFAIPWCGQALWVICVCMPAIAVNSIPLSAFEALSAQGNVEARSRDSKGHGQWAETESGGEEAGKKREFGVTTTEKLGMILFLFGFAVENLADYRKSNWWDEKRRKLHNEDFLTKGLWERRFVSVAFALSVSVTFAFSFIWRCFSGHPLPLSSTATLARLIPYPALLVSPPCIYSVRETFFFRSTLSRFRRKANIS